MNRKQLLIVGRYLGWYVIYMALTFGCVYLYKRHTEDFFLVVLGGVCFVAGWINFVAGAIRAQLMLNNDDETSEG